MFRGLKEAYFDAFCHISRLEILRAESLLVLYLVVYLLFRGKLIYALVSVRTVEQLNSSNFRVCLSLIIYITIYTTP